MKAFDRLRKGQVNVFGRTIPLALLAIAALAIPVAALLLTYIQVTGTAQVKQSVTLNAMESTFKYNILSLQNFSGQGITSFSWSTNNTNVPGGKMVGGDEQDVGLLLSNYAEIAANTTIDVQTNYTNSTGGPIGGVYQNCIDVNVTIWNEFTPSNNVNCTAAIGNEALCNSFGYCTYNTTSTICKGNEMCKGSQVLSSCNLTADKITTNTPITVAARPNQLDPTIPREDWICIKHEWHIAAVPGTYGFNVQIKP
ncbi:MAG: hypothetical protein HYX24_01185 [Candidatus Aenigmarchaeota archaeon]|nr:hypothetical protein [Candidatus Aenigmarchaeota archaeon]